jgi:hypothetical protein
MNQNHLWGIEGTVESVDQEHNTISFWIDYDWFETPQEVALTEHIPQWLRFPGVTFSAYMLESRLRTSSMGGAIFAPFLCDGTEYWTEDETYWKWDQIYKKICLRIYDKRLTEEPARACERSLRLLMRDLLSLHQSEAWPMLLESTESKLECAVQEIRRALVLAFQALDREYPSLHTLCTSALKKYAPENEDDFTGCFDIQRLHAHISYLLDCEADAVILARLLMEIEPTLANSLQAMIEQYHQQAVSPIADLVEAED